MTKLQIIQITNDQITNYYNIINSAQTTKKAE